MTKIQVGTGFACDTTSSSAQMKILLPRWPEHVIMGIHGEHAQKFVTPSVIGCFGYSGVVILWLNGQVKDPWPRVLSLPGGQGGFVGDPTSLARDNIVPLSDKMSGARTLGRLFILFFVSLNILSHAREAGCPAKPSHPSPKTGLTKKLKS